MVRYKYRFQLLFKVFVLPFGTQLLGANYCIKLTKLISWDALEDDYAAQFRKGFGILEKFFRTPHLASWSLRLVLDFLMKNGRED